MAWIWLGVALAFLIGEILTTAFFAVFGAAGAAGAAVVAALGFAFDAQAVVFAVVSLAGVVLGRPPLLRYLARRREPVMLSGAENMVGQIAVVVDPIRGPHQQGHVRIAGENWPALSEDGGPVRTGSEVVIKGLRQATLVVAEKPKE